MNSHWSLVTFTLLIQSAAGCVWCAQIALALGLSLGPVGLEYRVSAALIAVAAGLAAAMAHLGNPAAAFHAVRNLKSSWLSREVTTVNLLAGLLAALVLAGLISPGSLNGWSLLPADLAAGLALYAMTRVYRLRTVPAWNRAATPLNYLGSALILGGMLFTLTGCPPAAGGEGAPIAFVFALAGAMVKLLAAAAGPAAGRVPGREATAWWPVVQGLGMAFWALFLPALGGPAWRPVWLGLAAAGLVTGEIMQRVRFFHSYQRVGL